MTGQDNDAADDGAISALLTTGRLLEGQNTDDIKFPDIGDLAARLRFALKDGRIWLDTQRVALLHLSTLNSLRRELIDSLGIDQTRGFLTRMGYASGARDADLARKIRPHHTIREAFLVGPQLRILQGVSAPEPVKLEIDIARGRFHGEFAWPETFELDAHTAAYGASHTPVCWMHSGYLSGYSSGFMGKPIIFQEIECRSMGASKCYMIGKPREQWDEAEIEETLRALQPEDFVNRLPRRKAVSLAATGTPARLGPPGMAADLVGASPGFIATCHLIKKVAGTNATTLFLGETGVGKEKFARTLHLASKRAERPFVAVNCAAIPDNLVEAELFGVEKGAFTGAVKSRPGRFERAHGGTLFLDEIGALSLPAQIKLMRAIQEREIERVGGTATKHVDVRIVAATNTDLKEAVKRGQFRNDLLFRINVFPIHIPPLRDRRDDIPLLMDYFLAKYVEAHGKNVTGFTEKGIDALFGYGYPGNIRELENMIERAVILADEGQPIDIAQLFTADEDIPEQMLKLNRSGTLNKDSGSAAKGGLVDRILDESRSLLSLEEDVLRAAVERSNGNLSAAARRLGISRPQLAYRLKKLAAD